MKRVVLIDGRRRRSEAPADPAAIMVEAISTAGAETEVVRLSALRIEQCRHCPDPLDAPCRAGQCAIGDDFADVVARLRAAEAAAFLSPVHLGQLSKEMRAFLHRLHQVCQSEAHRHGIGGKPAIGVCLGGGASGCCQRLCGSLRALGMTVLATVAARRDEVHLNRAALRQAALGLLAPARQDPGQYIGRRARNGHAAPSQPKEPAQPTDPS